MHIHLSKMYGTIAVGAMLFMTGCAGFKAHELPDVDTKALTFTSSTKTKVFSRWSLDSESTLGGDQAKVMASALHKKYFDDAITLSNCCILVEGPTEASVIVDGKAINENNPAAMIPAMITGFSLFTIPSWATGTTHIVVQANGNGISKTYDLKDSMTMVMWLPMLFAMPFTDNPISGGKEVDENVYKTLVLNMKKDGLLK